MLQRQTVGSFNRGIFAGGEGATLAHISVGDDVVVGAVLILDASDPSAAVGIVFNFTHGELAVLGQAVGQEAIVAFDAATAVTHRNATLVVLAGELFFAQRERLERFLVVI